MMPRSKLPEKPTAKKDMAPEICPVCGAEIPASAPACPECGADDSTGWNPGAAASDGLGLNEDNFDYDSFIKREFGIAGNPRSGRYRAHFPAILILIATALTVIALLIFAAR